MRTRALAVVASVVMVSALCAAGGAAASRPRDTAPRSGGFLSSSQVPWSSVGTGWLLAQWSRAHLHVDGLVLISPTGTRYLLSTTAAGVLEGWSGDGQRALLETFPVKQNVPQQFNVLDLRSGATLDSFVFPTSNAVLGPTGGFTNPSGLALLVETQTNDQQLLARYSLSGALEQSFPTAFPGLGRYTGVHLSSPDGTYLVLGALHGFAIVGNDGTVRKLIHFSGPSYCNPLRWWTATAMLVQCGTPSQLYEQPLSGGAPTAITRKPVPPDDGDLNAWRVDRSTFVWVASACGYRYLAKLHGDAPIMVHVPGVPNGRTVDVNGATSTALALTVSFACRGGPSLLWYWPSGNHVKVLLGQPATAGTEVAAFTYPDGRG